MNLTPTFLNFLLTLMNKVSSLVCDFHDVIPSLFILVQP